MPQTPEMLGFAGVCCYALKTLPTSTNLNDLLWLVFFLPMSFPEISPDIDSAETFFEFSTKLLKKEFCSTFFSVNRHR